MGRLQLTPAGFKTWKLIKNFKVNTSLGTIVVPKGKITDLASTPRILWIILPPFGRYTQAAVTHDHLYGINKYSRKDCDKTFYELMIRYGTYKWKALIMYYGVRLYSVWLDCLEKVNFINK